MATSPSDLGLPRVCRQGHDTWTVGRVPGNNECCSCTKLPRMCAQGHDTWETGRYKACGGCRACYRARALTRQRARHAGRPKSGGSRPATGKHTTEETVDPERFLRLAVAAENAATPWEREEIKAQMAEMLEEAKR